MHKFSIFVKKEPVRKYMDSAKQEVVLNPNSKPNDLKYILLSCKR